LSKVQVDTIDTRSGTSTMQIGSTNTSTINIGVSGDTINIPSGVTIANAGTATGFGGDNTPAFLAGLSGDKGTYGAGATTKVQFDNQIVDTDDAYDPSTNFRFTVPSGASGNYMINISLDIQSTTNGRATNVSIYKNGGMVTTGGYFLTSQYFQNDQPSINTISQMLNLSAGDYIEAYGFMYDGGNHTFKAARSFFSGYKLIT